MRIINFGSLNLDYVYQVSHFVQPGETLHAKNQTINCGGKGLNQSIALARAGVKVYHAGCIGAGGDRLLQELEQNQVDTRYLKRVDDIQGNAIIQVDEQGENCILLYGGSNQAVTIEQVKSTLSHFGEGDYLVLQNEISCLSEIIQLASIIGMKIVLNPSPFEETLQNLNYEKISWLIVNEIEAAQISGCQEPKAAWQLLHEKYPNLNMVITLGGEGAMCCTEEGIVKQAAYKVKAVDTTAAGDTFTGYFLASLIEGKSFGECMERAMKAAAISVSKTGAAASIPYMQELNMDLLHRCFYW